MSGQSQFGLRSDAARNRQRIVEAARVLFAERGIDVPLSTVARRAGVGVATLFRRFPDREALVAEVFAEQITRCEGVLDEAVADPDPWHGFCRLLGFVCRTQIEDRGFTEALLRSFAGTVVPASYDERRGRAEATFGELVRRAQAAGGLRRDFVPGDLALVLLANGGLRSLPDEQAHALSRRLVAYLIEAFRADGRVSLPPAGGLGLGDALPGR